MVRRPPLPKDFVASPCCVPSTLPAGRSTIPVDHGVCSAMLPEGRSQGGGFTEVDTCGDDALRRRWLRGSRACRQEPSGIVGLFRPRHRRGRPRTRSRRKQRRHKPETDRLDRWHSRDRPAQTGRGGRPERRGGGPPATGRRRGDSRPCGAGRAWRGVPADERFERHAHPCACASHSA